MVMKPNAIPEPDEDIIELTDIIERGSPPAPGAVAPHADDPLRDLLHEGGNKAEDNDLDALLAELGASSQTTPKDIPGRIMQNAVNPDETLNMPNMREVEHLLDELDIPAQAPASAGAAAAEHIAGEDLDALIDQLGGASSAVPAAPDPADELDALLDSAAAAPAAPAEIPDAPPESVTVFMPAAPQAAQTTKPSITVRASATLLAPAAKPAVPKAPEAPAAATMDDLDALLESTAAAKPAPPEISASPNLTDDLDAFLESIPPASSGDDADKTLPSPPEQAAADTAVARASTPPRADQTPAFVHPAQAVAASGEEPLLPRQWDSLLGHAPELTPAAQSSEGAPGAVPPEILERLAQMETRLAELGAAGWEARLTCLEDKNAAAAAADEADALAFANFEKRVQDLENRANAVPAVSVDNAMHELNAVMGKTEQRVNVLAERIRVLEDTNEELPATTEESALSALSATLEATAQRVSVLEATLREITAAQSEADGQDSPALQALQTLVRGMEERFVGLETRLDKLERGSKEELERAAAAAAARILREELSAILAEEAK